MHLLQATAGFLGTESQGFSLFMSSLSLLKQLYLGIQKCGCDADMYSSMCQYTVISLSGVFTGATLTIFFTHTEQ